MIGKPFNKLTDEEKRAILDRVRQYRDIGQSGNVNLMTRMREEEDYANGEQWDPAFAAEQEERGKLCLTINLIDAQLQQLLGHIVQNPRELTMYNSRGGMKILADLQSALIEHTMADQNARHQSIQWADQAITTGCSYLALFKNTDSDPKGGDLEILRLNEFQVLSDPSCLVYDINAPRVGARFLIWEAIEDRAYVEAHWPDAMERFGVAKSEPIRDVNGVIAWMTDTVISGVERLRNWLNPVLDLFSQDKLRIPVTHCWWNTYIPVEYFYDLREDELSGILLADPDEIKKAKQAVAQWPEVFELQPAVAPVMNHSIALGNEVLLDHRVDEFNLLQTGLTLYPVVPLHAKFRNGYKAGVTAPMMGPQKWFNWMRSEVLNIFKNQPNSGYFVNGGSAPDKQFLEDHGGQDGIVIDRSLFGGVVERIEPANMPPLEQLAEVGKSEIKECVNMHTDAPEDEPKSMSGFALRVKAQKGITGVSPVLANYDYSLKMWGQLLSAVIRANPVYNPAEIKEIVEENNLLDPQLLQECRQAVATTMGKVLPEPPRGLDPLLVAGLQPEQASKVKQQYERHTADYQRLIAAIDAKAKPMAITALIDAMHNARRGRYQCRVTLSAEGVTQRARAALTVAEVNQQLLASQQAPLSDKYIIENSDLPKKEEILAERGYGK